DPVRLGPDREQPELAALGRGGEALEADQRGVLVRPGADHTGELVVAEVTLAEGRHADGHAGGVAAAQVGPDPGRTASPQTPCASAPHRILWSCTCTRTGSASSSTHATSALPGSFPHTVEASSSTPSLSSRRSRTTSRIHS